MGSERWLDNIFVPCVTVIGLLDVKKESLLLDQRSDDDQRYKRSIQVSILCESVRGLVVIDVGWRGMTRAENLERGRG
jgi:hypothetical protein